MRPLRDALALGRATARTYGASGLVDRSSYELQRRSGWLTGKERRVVVVPLQLSLDLETAPLASWYGRHPDAARDAVRVADALLEGRLSLFGGDASEVGWPPAWDRHPATGRALPGGAWTTLSDRGDLGDVRDPWELGRLCWTGRLLRAAAATSSPAYLDALRASVSSFRRSCPAGDGVHWMSGQEIAIRGTSLLFAWAALAPGDRTEALRDDLDAILVPSVARVMATLRYAASQRNNHYISEAAFLWTAAASAEGLPDRASVLARAAAALRRGVADQFAGDGSYAQHSFTYQRLALHALLWVAAVARATGREPPVALDPVFVRSSRLLASVVDAESGRVPNFGANDGALLFQLTSRPIADFRPLLVHLAIAAGREPSVPAGACDEEAVWFGRDAATARAGASPSGSAGAYHVLRGPASFAFVHAGRHQHRPSHADQLHLDLWIAGTNVAIDLGTYRYTAPAPWANALADARVHNVPLPDGTTQARRLGRFFWLDWPAADVLATATGEDTDALVAEVALIGERGATARRLVARAKDRYVVVDRCRPAGGTVRWNLPVTTSIEVAGNGLCGDGPGWWLRCRGGTGSRALERDPAVPGSGWASPTYGGLEPVTVVEVRTDPEGLVVSAFGPTGVPAPPDDVLASFRAALHAASAASLRDALAALVRSGADAARRVDAPGGRRRPGRRSARRSGPEQP